MRNFDKKALKDAVEKLQAFPGHERQKAIFYYRFGINADKSHTLEETGKVFDITRERVRQIETKISEWIGGLDKYLLSE